LASEAQGKGSTTKIGQTYFFDCIGEKDQLGTVTFANVLESEKKVYFTMVAEDGTNHLLAEPISDEALADYKVHPEAFFGAIQHVGKRANKCLRAVRILPRRLQSYAEGKAPRTYATVAGQRGVALDGANGSGHRVR
jgi:hypothetical protein